MFHDLIVRVPIREPAHWHDEGRIEDAVAALVKLVVAPIPGAVVGEASLAYCEHVAAGEPGDAPLTEV